MFELIKLNPDDITIDYDSKVSHPMYSSKTAQPIYFWIDNMFTHSIMNEENFTRTLARVDDSRIMDLEQRSSWTHKKTFNIRSPEITEYFRKKVAPRPNANEDHFNEGRFQLLKYEKGDFFKKHLDTKQSHAHEYTCLIVINDKENNYVGGELILSDQNDIYNIHVSEASKAECVMIIFSIDLYHEITPITKGARYVFKTHMFDYVDRPESTYANAEENEDISTSDFWNSTGGLAD